MTYYVTFTKGLVLIGVCGLAEKGWHTDHQGVGDYY